MQRRLFTLALFVSLIVGVILFVVSPTVDAATKKKSPSPSLSPSTTITPSPSGSPTVSPSASPSPEFSVAPQGDEVKVRQTVWKTQDKSVSPIKVEELAELPKDGQCDAGKNKDSFTASLPNYTKLNKLTVVADSNQKFGTLEGPVKGNLENNYVISSVLSAHKGNSALWETMSVVYRRPMAATMKVYYRISDTGGTNNPTDSGWIELAEPTDLGGLSCKGKRAASYNINRTGKYFQYKIAMKSPSKKDFQAVYWVDLAVQGVDRTEIIPSPTPTPSASPSPKNVGKITVLTKKLIIEDTSTTTKSTAPLPNLTPTPKATASNQPTKINPVCFSKQETEPAPGVPISVKQTEGGKTRVEDQQTDDDGQWNGLSDEEADEFPVGTYIVNFGDFEKQDFKLVALCVSPDDGKHHLKTQTSPTANKATILVRQGEETTVTALYAPRDKPYIAMNKFAINQSNKILKAIYVGQNFRYLIRYENTGDADAKNVTIQDVLPEQFYVPDNEVLDEKTDYTTNLDAQGRTTITKKLDRLTKGQKGSILVPVTLKPDAFGYPADIAGSSQSPAAQASSFGDFGSSGSTGLELQ